MVELYLKESRKISGWQSKYLWLEPIAGKYKNIVDNNCLSIRYVFYKYKKYLPEYYYQVIHRNGKCELMPLPDLSISSYNKNNASLFQLLEEKRYLCIRPTINKEKKQIVNLYYGEGRYYINAKEHSKKEMKIFFDSLEDTDIVTEDLLSKNILKDGLSGESLKLSLLIINKTNKGYVIADAYVTSRDIYNLEKSFFISECNIKHVNSAEKTIDEAEFIKWDKVRKLIEKISKTLVEIEFFGMDLVFYDDEPKILEIQTHPKLPENFFENPILISFFKEKINQKKLSLGIKRKVFLTCKYIYSFVAQQQSYMGFMMKNWQKDLIKDWLKTDTSIWEKIWAHRRGFLSFRIKQYDLKDDNLDDFLPDRAYRKLRPINNEFVSWVYDKVVTRYILDKNKEYLPEYYYHLIYINSEKVIMSLHDCPKDCTNDISGVLKLLKQKKKLILKPSEGSHGKGVFKIECFNDNYIVNDIIVDENVLIDKIESLKGFYNITEYIEMHSVLKKFYDKTTYTIRIMVINEHGVDPWLANAYMRIAATSTGVTDNISDGGICARIDITTGEIFEPEQIINHVIMPCRFHPDTGVEIKGKVPNWELVKDGVLDVSRYIGQLEYLGFDVVVTEDGFKILEINTHQDLHRYPHYDKKIHEYFLRKCEQKQV